MKVLGYTEMKFNQNLDDGSCEIIFSEEEKKIIAKNGKIFFPAVTFKHFTNAFIKMVADWNLYFKRSMVLITIVLIIFVSRN